MAHLLHLLVPALLLIHTLETSPTISPMNVKQTNVSEVELPDSHAPNYQVYPLLRLRLTSSVLPAAIQMLTSYIEKLEQIQKTLQEISTQNHHNHFTSTTPSPLEPEVVDAYSLSANASQVINGTSSQEPTNASSGSLLELLVSSVRPTQSPDTTDNNTPTQGTGTTVYVSSTESSTTLNSSPGTTTTQEAHPEPSSPTDTTSTSTPTVVGTSEHPVDIVQSTPNSKVETIQSNQNTSTESVPPGTTTSLTEPSTDAGQPLDNVSTSINSTVEEVIIPNELYELTTSQNEMTDIPTESWENVDTTTESSEGSTSVYELNINEETLVDIELIFGDKKSETNENTKAHVEGTKSGKRLKYEENDFKKKMKTVASASGDRNQHKTNYAENNMKVPRNITNLSNRFNQNIEAFKNKTLPITNSAYYNKTSNIVKNTLQNILAQQRNKTSNNPTPMKQKVTQTLTNPLQNIKKNITAGVNKYKLSNKTQDINQFGTKIYEDHLKESNFNKSSDEIFMNTLNEIVTEEKALEKTNNTGENVKTKNGHEVDLMTRFWSLANFFTAMHNFLSGDLHVVQQAANKISEKREENYLKNVTRQLMFLKIFYNIEAKNARLWRYHGYSKSASKFLKAASEVPSSEQLKLTMTRLIERGNIKHERTIEATKKFIEELETTESNVIKALNQCPTMRFT